MRSKFAALVSLDQHDEEQIMLTLEILGWDVQCASTLSGIDQTTFALIFIGGEHVILNEIDEFLANSKNRQLVIVASGQKDLRLAELVSRHKLGLLRRPLDISLVERVIEDAS